LYYLDPEVEPPVITSGTLKLSSAAQSTGQVYLPDTKGLHRLQFEASFTDKQVSLLRVIFDKPSATFNPVNPTGFECKVVEVNGSFVDCITEAGVGRDLVFILYFRGFPSLRSVDTLSYPVPSITNDSLRLFGGAPSDAVLVLIN